MRWVDFSYLADTEKSSMTFQYVVRQKPGDSVISLAFGVLALPLMGNGCIYLCNLVEVGPSNKVR